MTLAACLTAALAPSVSASPPRHQPDQPRAVHVSGRFIPIDDQGTYRVTGSLKGTWYTLTADTYYQSKAMIIQEGIERFEGCIDVNRDGRCDRKGAFGTDYIYWATFDSAPLASSRASASTRSRQAARASPAPVAS